MLSALLMLRRVSAAFRYAISEEDFLQIFGAGLFLALLGTLTYTVSQDWKPRRLAVFLGDHAHDHQRLRP